MRRDEGHARLRDAIVGGEFAPDQRLVESDLVAMLGVSRAAVRVALTRLEQEGLVVRERHRGARVRRIGPAEAVEITETRAVLEAMAARYAARRADENDIAALRAILAEMRERLAEGDLLGYSDGNGRLHARILDASGHRTAQRLVAGLKAHSVRFQYRTILVPGRRARSLAEHTRVVDAIAARDEDAAEAAMRAHLSQVADTLSESAQATERPGTDQTTGREAGPREGTA